MAPGTFATVGLCCRGEKAKQMQQPQQHTQQQQPAAINHGNNTTERHPHGSAAAVAGPQAFYTETPNIRALAATRANAAPEARGGKRCDAQGQGSRVAALQTRQCVQHQPRQAPPRPLPKRGGGGEESCPGAGEKRAVGLAAAASYRWEGRISGAGTDGATVLHCGRKASRLESVMSVTASPEPWDARL